MTLEDLVPPLELCKQIPEGEFEDSALVYGLLGHQNGEEVYAVWLRLSTDKGDKIIPAPTLAEIMLAIDKLDEGDLPACTFTGVKWRMESVSGPFSASIKRHHTSDKNPATAALKLWLEIKKEEK